LVKNLSTITNPNKVAALIKDINAWNAFIALLDHHQYKCIRKLDSIADTEELIRINAEYRLIERLRKAREDWLAIEQGLRNNANE
jgi:hypothetical protein